MLLVLAMQCKECEPGSERRTYTAVQPTATTNHIPRNHAMTTTTRSAIWCHQLLTQYTSISKWESKKIGTRRRILLGLGAALVAVPLRLILSYTRQFVVISKAFILSHILQSSA